MSNFLREECGQDLVEWALLIAFITMAAAAFFFNGAQSIAAIWGHANSELQVANTIS